MIGFKDQWQCVIGRAIVNVGVGTSGGWLGPGATATNNGATLLREAAVAVWASPVLLFVCQWNNFGADIFNVSLGNDMEPAEGWGFRYLNVLRAMALFTDSAEQLSGMMQIIIASPVPWTPVATTMIPLQWATLGRCPNLSRFDIYIDGVLVASVDAVANENIFYDAQVPISGMVSGWHNVTVTAMQSDMTLCAAPVDISYETMSWDFPNGTTLASDTVCFVAAATGPPPEPPHDNDLSAPSAIGEVTAILVGVCIGIALVVEGLKTMSSSRDYKSLP